MLTRTGAPLWVRHMYRSITIATDAQFEDS